MWSAFVHAAGLVAADEFIEIFSLDGGLLECEVQVCAEIVNPKLVRPAFGSAFLLFEEDHVRFHAGRIPDARR
jgi:hypothetical protein